LTEKLLDRIGALLAKAESTDSDHEAEALVSKAQQLATLHAVDLATARQRTQRRQRREQVEQRKLVLGRRGEMGLRHRVLLYVKVAHVNDIEVDVARDSTYVIAFGFPSDLEVVDALYASLATQMTAAASAAIRRGEHKDDPYWSDAAGAWRTDARVFRSAFNDGFIAAVADRLRDARAAALATDREADAPAASRTGSALVLVAKAAEVTAFHRQTSDARGTWRGQRHLGAPSSPRGRRAGRAAGHAARLSSARPISGARGSVGPTVQT
jgi:hypothetical protein